MKMHMLKEAPQDHQTAKKNVRIKLWFLDILTNVKGN